MDKDKLNNINKRKHDTNSDRPTVSYHGSSAASVGHIGQYKLLSVLGEGGFSVVYLAEQSRPVHRLVALKVIKPGMDTKQVIARFEVERQTLALLNHPNIAPVYDAGATEQGLPYFVMENVKGIPITEHCDRNKLSIEERLDLFLQVCDGVHYAHQKGIIHRDIKPSNILVSIDGDKVAPRIIDFGVSKAITKQINERTLFTEQGQFVGTPEYMSPEQAEMGAQDIDTRTDIYSLGVVLYELLTGALPFDPETLRESSIDNIRKIIREQDPKRPSTHLISLGDKAKKIAENRSIDLSNLKKRLNRELEWIPLKAMRKDRTRRYRSVSQFADDIRNYLNGRPLLAGPESTFYRMQKFAHRNRPLLTGVTAVLIVLIVGIVVSTNFGITASRAQKKAEQEARNSQAISDFLRKDLLEAMNPYVVQNQDITVRSLLDDISEKLEGRFENEPLIEAQIRYSLGKSYRNLGTYDLAEKHLQRAYALQLEKLGNKNTETLNTMGLLGSVYMRMGLYKYAQTLFEQTYNGRKENLGDEDPSTLSAMNELALLYLSWGQYDKAEDLYTKALPISEKLFGDSDAFTLMLEGNLADIYRFKGQYDKAEEFYTKARQNIDDLYYNNMPTTEDTDILYYAIYSGNGLGMLYIIEGKYPEAERLFREALSLGESILETGHPDTLYSMNGLGYVYTAMKNYDLASDWLIKARNTGREKLGENNPTTLTSLYCLGWLEYNIGISKYEGMNYEQANAHFDEAEDYLLEALYGRQRVLGSDHPATLETKNALGMLYFAMGRYSDAKLQLEDTLKGRTLKLGADHPDTITTQQELDDLEYYLEDSDIPTEDIPASLEQ